MSNALPESMPRIVAIGVDPNIAGCRVVKFFGPDTLQGYDLIILHVRQFLRAHDVDSITSSEHDKYAEHISNRAEQILVQIRLGVTFVVIPSLPNLARKIDGEYFDFDLVNFRKAWNLLHVGVGLAAERGIQFDAKNQAFDHFLKGMIEHSGLEHHVRLNLLEGMAVGLTIPNSETVVAGAQKIGSKGGLVLYLPEPNFTQSEFYHFRQAVWQLALDLRQKWPASDVREAMPTWADNYPLPGEKELLDQIADTKEKFDELEASQAALESQLEDRRKDKRLFTSYDKSLEEAVEDALTALGFRVERPQEANRTDRIAWYEDRAVVLEIKGRTKTASGDNLGQVMKWKGIFYEQQNRHSDAAILLVNGWRDLPLEERDNKIVFEPNIVTDASRENIGLMTGLQLLGLKIAVSKGELDTAEARERIFQSVGLFEGNFTLEVESIATTTVEPA